MSDTLSISRGGQTILGRFTYRSREYMQVEIVTAIYPFRSSLTMYVPESRSAGGLMGPEGIASGGRLLRDLHRLCRFLMKNRARLLERHAEYQIQLNRIERGNGLTDFWLDRKADALYMELQKGKIGEEEYNRTLADAERRNVLYHRYRRLLDKEFFARFPFSLSPEVRHQVLEWLRWESSAERPSGAPRNAP